LTASSTSMEEKNDNTTLYQLGLKLYGSNAQDIICMGEMLT